MECGFECNVLISCNVLRYVNGVCQLGIKRVFTFLNTFLLSPKVHFVAEDTVAQRMEFMTLKYTGMVYFL